MILDDVSAPSALRWERTTRRVTWSVRVDWASWALPLSLTAGPLDVKQADGTTQRLWEVVLGVGPVEFGAWW